MMEMAKLEDKAIGRNGNFNIKLAPILRFDKIAAKIVEHADVRQNVASFRKVKWILNRYNLPEETYQRIIHELIALGYLRRNNKRELEVLKTT